MHPLLGTEQDGISITYRCAGPSSPHALTWKLEFEDSSLWALAWPDSCWGRAAPYAVRVARACVRCRALLASESKGEPTLAEVKTEDFRIREDLLRLLQVWDTLSEGTKVFLQMHCEQQAGYVALPLHAGPGACRPSALIAFALLLLSRHPSGSLVTTKQLVGKVDAGHSLALKSPVKGCASTRSVAAGVHEECKGMDINLEPLPRAPENVFLLRDDQVGGPGSSCRGPTPHEEPHPRALYSPRLPRPSSCC
jgi:hypothetical protein